MTVQGATQPKRTPAKPPRVDLVAKEFDNIIQDQGVHVRVTPSLLCPNYSDLGSTNHDLNCAVCSGSGAADLPARSYETIAVITSINFKLTWAPQGAFHIKDAQVTLRGGNRLWYYDKIEVLDHTSIYNELVKKTGARDRLRYEAIQAVTSTPIYLIDSTGKEYIVGTDFNLVGRYIEWVTVGPPEGDLYSIQYPILPVYRVLELLHESRYYYESDELPNKTPVHLPQQCIIRWDHLTDGSGINEPIVTE